MILYILDLDTLDILDNLDTLVCFNFSFARGGNPPREQQLHGYLQIFNVFYRVVIDILTLNCVFYFILILMLKL